MNFAEIEERTGYVFKDKKLLQTALTLASANESENNQTLEFFGDAILEFLVSEKIYDPSKTEGELTEMRKAYVSDKALSPVSEKLGLPEYFIKGGGDNVNKKSVPSAYEALLAAIYLDGGMDAARAFVARTLKFGPVETETNFKGELQELLQGNGEALPNYKVRDVGTPQKPEFRCELTVQGKTFTGTGSKKQYSEQNAAQAALEYLKSRR